MSSSSTYLISTYVHFLGLILLEGGVKSGCALPKVDAVTQTTNSFLTSNLTLQPHILLSCYSLMLRVLLVHLLKKHKVNGCYF